jgi:hypothetical protein
MDVLIGGRLNVEKEKSLEIEVFGAQARGLAFEKS